MTTVSCGETVGKQRRMRLRYTGEAESAARLNLPTEQWLRLKLEAARIWSLGLEEPVFVFFVEGRYWCGTRSQIETEIAWGVQPDVISTYLRGEPVTGVVAYDASAGDYHGFVGGGE